MDPFIYFISVISGLFALVSFTIHYQIYRRFSLKISRTLVLANFFILVWISLDFVLLNFVNDISQALQLSSISASFLTTGLYLTHYFYDELSASYRQRKTMTLASIIFGLNLGMSWISSQISVDLTRGVKVSSILVLMLLIQGIILSHRIVRHLQNQVKLTDHYDIPSIFKKGTFVPIILPIVFVTISAILVYLFTDFTPYTTPFYLIVAFGYLFLSMISSRDPLSSMPVAQPLEAIALISENEDEQFRYIFAKESAIDEENFGDFIRGVGGLLTEIIKSESRIVSFNSIDLVVMFEPIGERTLVLILKKRNPGIRTLLERAANSFTQSMPSSNIEFIARVKRYFQIPETGGRFPQQEFLIVYNHRSASYKKTRKRYEFLLNRHENLLIDDFTSDYLKQNSPDAVVVLGGDGTVHSVCSTVLHSGLAIKVGILPGGGGNDIYDRWYYRDLEYFDKSNTSNHPVFKIEYADGHLQYATNTIEWGIGALVAQKRENNEGRVFLGMSKYFYLLLKSLRLYRSWESKVIIDGEEFDFDDLSAIVVGFGSSSMGGGYMMFPDEADTNQKREAFVLIARGFEKASGLSLIVKLARMKQYKDDRVIYKKFKNLELIPSDEKGSLPITVDGELRPSPPLKISVADEVLTSIRHY
ncbi:MAG: diacylglycerol/lipid kinase family protein [Candidatus Kariarchaeaceae archaeon]|jgi:diacylglycerol kinase family enzyme